MSIDAIDVIVLVSLPRLSRPSRRLDIASTHHSPLNAARTLRVDTPVSRGMSMHARTTASTVSTRWTRSIDKEIENETVVRAVGHPRTSRARRRQ